MSVEKQLFVIQDVLPGKLNALVKNIMDRMGINDPNEAVRRVNSGEWTVKPADLLRKLKTVKVGGAEKFVMNDEALASANVGWTNRAFKTQFLGKVEESVEDAVIAAYCLEKRSPGGPIMTELGSRIEIKLVHFFGLLARQSGGRKGYCSLMGAPILPISRVKTAISGPWAPAGSPAATGACMPTPLMTRTGGLPAAGFSLAVDFLRICPLGQSL